MANPRFDDIAGEVNTQAAPRFDAIEEAKPAESSFRDKALGVAGHLAEALKGMVVPQHEDYAPVALKEPQRAQFPDDRSYLEAVKLYGDNTARMPAERAHAQVMNQDEQGLARFSGMDVTGLGGKAADLVRPSAQRALDLAAQTNPKTALLSGSVAPLGEGLKTLAPVAAGVGALNAKAHGNDPLAGGLENAALVTLMHLGFKGAGAIASPLLKNLHERAAAGEPINAMDPHLIAALDERKTSPGYEPPTQTDPVNLLHAEDPYVDPTAVNGPAGGVPTRGDRPYFGTEGPTDVRTPRSERETMMSKLPPPVKDEVTRPSARVQRAELLGQEPRTNPLYEPERANPGKRVGEDTRTDRPYFRDMEVKTKTGPLRADEFPPEPSTQKMYSHATDAEQVAAVEQQAQLAGRKLSPEKMNTQGQYMPRDLLKEMKDAAAAKFEGKSLLELRAEERQPQTPLQRVALKNALKAARGEGTNAGVASEQVKFDDAMQFLTGEDSGTEKTKTRYVPRDTLYPEKLKDPNVTHIPLGKAQPMLMGGSGEPPRNPRAAYVAQPPVEPGPLMPNEVPDSFHDAAAEYGRANAKDRGFVENMKRSLSLPENRAPEDVAAAIRGLKAARAVKDMAMEKLFPAMDKSLKRLTPSERIAAKRTISDLQNKRATVADVSKLPPEFRDLFNHANRETQSMMLDLARRGYFTAAEMKGFKANLDEGHIWLHRSYQAFLAKKGFSPTTDARVRAARFLMESEKLPEAEAHAKVEAVVRKLQEMKGPRSMQSVSQLFKDQGLTKKRSFSPQLRALLGVIDDPSFVVVDTVGEMAQMYHQARVTDAIAQPQNNGVIWSNTPLPNMHPERLWNDALGVEGNRRAFGALAGKYVSPQLHEVMADAASPQARGFLGQLTNAVMSWFALAKVVTSPTTMARNLLSNSFNLMVSGVPMQRWPQLTYKAVQALRAEGRNLSLKEAGAGQWARMAIEDHALAPGRGTDWGGAEARNILENVLREPQKGLVGVFDSLFRKYNGARSKMGKVYELGDSLPRLMAYMHHVQDGVHSLGLSEASARARASHLVNRYFATGASVGPAFRAMSQSGGAPFGAWFVDNMRVTKNIMADAGRGQFGPAFRAAVFSGIPMGAFYAMRQLYGVTDAEVHAAERKLKGSWRDRNAFHDWLPIRGKDGLMYAVSFDGLNPMATFFKGAEGSFPKNIAANVAQGLTQSGWAEPLADKLLSHAGLAPAPYEAPVLPGQEGYRLANDISQYLQPSLMRQFQDVARKAQLAPESLPLRNEEPQSLGEAAFTTFNPLSVEKVGPRTMEAARKQTQGAYGNLNDARKQAKKLPGEESAKVKSEALRRIEELRRKQSTR